MLHRCRGKLNSRRGASFLLALLFFLICALAASVVLMAAASNAGRSRSSREEHKVYLGIASAVRLLCDELTAAEYRGQYEYTETEFIRTDPVSGESYKEIVKTIAQLDGLYRYQKGEADAALREPLLTDFDSIFSKEFKTLAGDIQVTGTKAASVIPHTLTITVSGTDSALDERPVEVTLTVVEESYAMEFTAAMEHGEHTYVMQGELTPIANKPTLMADLTPGTHTTDPMIWRVGRIVPGETAGEETEPGG